MYCDKHIISQFIKYSLVGGIASVIDISIYSTSIYYLGLNHLISNSLSLTAGLTVNYLLSFKWIFGINSQYGSNFLLFSVIGIIGFFISNFLLYVFIDLKILYYFLFSADVKLVKLAAKLIATGITLIWNFAARRKFVLSAG